MTDSNRKILAALFASLMMVSMVGAAVAPAAVGAAGPSGMVALGNAQISEDVPAGESVPIGASDLEGAVYASDHADTLEVVVTTPERASDYLENGTVVTNDEVALVLRDDQVHDGRDVAIDLALLEEAVGFAPEVAYGTHDSGEEWQSPIEREGTNGIFHVPSFSSNSVTFSGGIELSGDAAGDGTSYQYELDNLDGVGSYAINLTGVNNSVWSNTTQTAANNDIIGQVGGNTEPTGPSGQPSIELTGKRQIAKSWDWQPGSTFRAPFGLEDGNLVESEFLIPNKAPDTISALRIAPQEANNAHPSNYGTVDIYIDEGAPDQDPTDGTLVKSNWKPHQSGSEDIQLDQVYNPQSDQVTVQFVTNDDGWSSEYSWQVAGGGDAYVSSYEYDKDAMPPVGLLSPSPKDISVNYGGQSTNIGNLNDGETVEKSIDPSPGDEISLSESAGGLVNASLKIKEKSVTTDPVVEVNGYETTHEGTLADGETTSLATNEAWLENGTNTVTINTASPSNGPESLVGFNYQHDASGTTKSVDVEATSWTERFNVSNTFPSSVAGADATLTFNEDVAEIDGVEYRKDGGEWTSPPGYELNGTDLEVDLGDVSADTTVDVRATGYKINTYDGEIDITSPTVEGDDLATEVEITSLLDGGMFGLRVDGTELGDRVHYASKKSWSGDRPHAEIASSGTQIMRAPDANVGSTMTVSSSPISVSPESGAVEVVVEDANEPRFRIREGNTTGASTVEVTYHDTLSGERYVLYSETEDREIDAARANSPVTFTTDGDTETYTIQQADREGAVGGGGPALESGGSSAPLILVVPAVGLSVGGLFFAGRRFGGFKGARGNAVLVAASAVVSVTALELVAPGSLLGRIYEATVYALGDAAASGLGAVLASIATIVGLWQLQQRTRADVPVWVTLPSVFLAAVLALESIRPGSVLGALEGVIAEVGALLALIAVAGIFWWWRRRNKVKQTEASTPDTQVTLDLGDQGGEE